MTGETEPIEKESEPKPGSPDPIEVHAAEVAKRHGHSRVTTEDRKLAYSELKRLSQDQSEDGEVSH